MESGIRSAQCPVCWHGEKCPLHRVRVCRFGHDGTPPLSKYDEDMRQSVRDLAVAVMELSGTGVLQVVEVAWK